MKTVFSYWIFFILLIFTGTIIPVILAGLLAFFAYLSYDSIVGQHRPPEKSLVVITGCSSGIGRSFAIKLAKKGVLVYAGVRKPEDGDKIKSHSENIIPIILDVTKPEQIKSAKLQVLDKLKEGYEFLGLVNNAGYLETGFLEIVSMEVARKQFEVNFFGQLAMSQEFVPLLRSYGTKKIPPKLIFVGSIGGSIPHFANGLYSSSKIAIESAATVFRQELAHWGIKVILVSPGSIKTDIFNPFTKEEPKTMEQIHGQSLFEVEPSVIEHYKKEYEKFSESAQTINGIGSTTDLSDRRLMTCVLGRDPDSICIIGPDAHFMLIFKYFPASLLDWFSRVV